MFNASHVTVGSGNLFLTATKTSSDGGRHPWASGVIEMNPNAPGGGNYAYGFFEARIKVPSPGTAWAAFWLVAANGWPPEIDIFEFSFSCNGVSGRPVFNSHGTTNGSNSNISGWPCSGMYGPANGDYTQFHTYGLEWKPGSIKVYFDGQLQSHISVNNGVPSTPMFPIINYSIKQGLTPPPSGSQMVVDYVRIWQ